MDEKHVSRVIPVQSLDPKLSYAMRSFHLGYWEMDMGQNLIRWSDEMYGIYGLDVGAPVYPGDLDRLVHEDDLPFIHTTYSNLREGIASEFEYRVVHSDGSVHDILSQCDVEQCPDGNILRLFGFMQDVTDRVRADRERTLAEDMVHRLDKLSAVGQLAAGFVHEIRNPLAAVKGFTQLLSERARESEQLYFRLIMSELSRIQDLTDELLVLAKPHPANLHMYEILPLVTEVTTLLHPQCLMQNVQFALRAPDRLPSIRCDCGHIKQVLINLLKNAMEAMPLKGSLTVTVGERVGHSQVFIEITDTGPGIAPAVLGRIGEPFMSTKEEGTGLGLFLCQRIIDHHHGELHIASEVGKGTTVTVCLPVAEHAPVR